MGECTGHTAEDKPIEIVLLSYTASKAKDIKNVADIHKCPTCGKSDMKMTDDTKREKGAELARYLYCTASGLFMDGFFKQYREQSGKAHL